MLLTVFIAATLAWTGLSLMLSLRQSRHVEAHRETVPADFAGSVSLEDHRKAADYTVARERVSRVDAVVGTALTLAWVLGGIGLLNRALGIVLTPGSLGFGVAFLIVAAALGTVIDLPLAVYRTFVLERRFGFNTTTPATFLADLLRRWALSLALAVPIVFAALWAMRTLTGL